jgi:hypothetical protein
MKRFLGLAILSAIAFSLAIGAAHPTQKDEQLESHQSKDWGLGDGVNGAIAATLLAGAGWAIGKFSSMGFKNQESHLKAEILKEAAALVEDEIKNNQEKYDLVIGRQLDAILNEIIGLSREIKTIEHKLDSSKISLERRVGHCENEIKRVDGNIDNVLPHVNQAILNAFSPFGVTPNAISVRKNPPSNPAFYQTEGHIEP